MSTLPQIQFKIQLVHFLKDWQTKACEPNPAWHLLLQMKFYWNMAMVINLYIT